MCPLCKMKPPVLRELREAKLANIFTSDYMSKDTVVLLNICRSRELKDIKTAFCRGLLGCNISFSSLQFYIAFPLFLLTMCIVYVCKSIAFLFLRWISRLTRDGRESRVFYQILPVSYPVAISCLGNGRRLNARWLSARKVLGREVPETPRACILSSKQLTTN